MGSYRELGPSWVACCTLLRLDLCHVSVWSLRSGLAIPRPRRGAAASAQNACPPSMPCHAMQCRARAHITLSLSISLCVHVCACLRVSVCVCVCSWRLNLSSKAGLTGVCCHLFYDVFQARCPISALGIKVSQGWVIMQRQHQTDP